MTSPRLPLAALIAATALASLTGCSPEPAMPTAPPAATAEPLFASDEEALAAAEAAYAKYLEVSDEVFAEGGANSERLKEVASGEALAEDEERAKEFQRESVRIDGRSEVIQSALQQHIQGSSEETIVVAYFCLDSYSIRVLDADGNEVGNLDRPATVTFETEFSSVASGNLVLSRSDLWTSGPTCES